MNEAATSDQGFGSWRVACGMVVLVLALSVMALAQSNHQDDDPLANQVVSGSAFGYADLPGRQVLVPVEPALARGMKAFRKAVTVPGRVVDLTYTGAQRAGDGDAGRQTPERFAETAGAVFAASEPVGPGGDVLVTTEHFLADRQVLAITPLEKKACAPALDSALAARAGRAVAWCKDVGAVEGGGVLSVARFVPKGRDELAVLVYNGPGGMVFLEYPGSADPGGTWRADDGGEFPLETYRPLFAFRTQAGLELAVRWAGNEGNAMDLYRQDGDMFVPFVAASWYRMEE